MENTSYSPYQCATLVNAQLKEQGIEKQLPPQMFYTYTKKEYIASFRDANNKVRVTHEALTEWFTKYINKHHNNNTTTENNIDPNQLSLEI